MEFWQALSFTETDQLVPLARSCEEAGFAGIFLSDHVFVPGRIESKYPYSADGSPPFTPATEHPEPWAAICAMAQVATRLRFSTAVYLVPLRHPLHLAKSLATASVLSGGRVALGAGVGWVREEFAALGKDFEQRGAVLDETLDVLRKLWAGGLVEHHGRCFDFGPLASEPRPVAPIPIWIGGTSAPALRRAARWDGWIGSGDTPESASARIARLRELRREAGLAAKPFAVFVGLEGPPDLGAFQRVAEAGATGFVAYPPAYRLGPGRSLDEKRRYLEGYGRDVIARY